MIYGNYINNTKCSVEEICVFESFIHKDCLLFDEFLREDGAIIQEASDFSGSIRRILEKLKEFLKSIPERIQKLWKKLKGKVLELLSRIRKKKKVDNPTPTTETKVITFDYIPYQEAVNNTSVELGVFHQLEQFVDKYIDPDLDKKHYTDQQQLFADAFNILNKSVVSKGEFGLDFKDSSNITDMIDRTKKWNASIEEETKKIEVKEAVEKYNNFDPDNIKDFISNLDKDLSATNSYFKGIEKSIDKMIKRNNSALEMEHWRYDSINGVSSIISGSSQFITSLITATSTIVGKSLGQYNKLSIFVDKYTGTEN